MFKRISTRHQRIGGAVVIAVILVAGGYLLPGSQLPKTRLVNAELTDELLSSYVSKDTDSDGLPDWQEALYDTNPNLPDTDGDGINDGDAVARGLLTPATLASRLPQEPIGEEDIPGEPPAPGSLTEEFSRSFFESYLKASGGQQMSAEARDALLNRLLADFSARAGKRLASSYTQLSVRTSASVGTREYAATVESILRRNEVDLGGETPLSLIEVVMAEGGDERARQKLLEISNAQENAARELLAASVPPRLASEHLLLLRSLDELARATEFITVYEQDPLGTMGALIVYPPASEGFVNSLRSIAVAIIAEGEPPAGTPGAYLIQLARSAEGL